MEVQKHLDRYYIFRGDSTFCFFVDDDKSCWTRRPGSRFRQGQAFMTEEDALVAVAQLKRREKLRRERKSNC